MIVDCRHLMFLHQHDHRVEKVAVIARNATDIGLIGRKTVNHRPMRFKRSNGLFDPGEVSIYFNLLRRLKPELHQIAVNRRPKVEADLCCVPDHLGRWLIETDYQSAFAPLDSVSQVLKSHDGFAYTRDTNHQSR